MSIYKNQMSEKKKGSKRSRYWYTKQKGKKKPQIKGSICNIIATSWEKLGKGSVWNKRYKREVESGWWKADGGKRMVESGWWKVDGGKRKVESGWWKGVVL
jgi:hypothetical protein